MTLLPVDRRRRESCERLRVMRESQLLVPILKAGVKTRKRIPAFMLVARQLRLPMIFQTWELRERVLRACAVP
jgi:hypothetical protein